MDHEKLSSSPFDAPALFITHGKKFRNQTFYKICDKTSTVKSVPELRRMKWLASNNGWLMLKSIFSNECHLFNPVTLCKINLPPLVHDTFKLCAFTYPPSDLKSVLVIISPKRKKCIFCRVGDTRWMKQDLEPKKKSDIKFVISEIHAAITFQGRVYLFANGGKGMSVIEVDNSSMSIKFHELAFQVDFVAPEAGFYKSFFLESRGEIFMVGQTFVELSAAATNFSQIVFKLDLSTMGWVKVESLGDRIFFLDISSTSLSESELGVKGNCLYFVTPQATTLCRFDMGSGATTTVTLPCPRKFPPWGRPFLMVPDCKEQVKNMMMACTALISVTPPHRSFPPLTKYGSQHLPWLFSFQKNNMREYVLNHPIHGDTHVMNLCSELQGATIRYARFGWLLLFQRYRSLLFFNPSTEATLKISYPVFGSDDLRIWNISFSCPPTSPDCVVLAQLLPSMEQVFLVYLNSVSTWYHLTIEVPDLFKSSCNPVFHSGLFYYLSEDGRLGLFDPYATKEEKQWWVVPNTLAVASKPCSWSSVSFYTQNIRSSIMECDGEILSVFIDRKGHEPIVYKLDRSNMKWVKLESLGDKVLFLSHTTSMSVSAGLEGIENRIYFPRFKGKESIYYSISSRNYHCFGGKEPCPDFTADTCEQWNCTWIQTYLDDQCDYKSS